MTERKSVSKSFIAAAIYTIIGFVPSLIGIILLPVYLLYLDPYEFGILTMLGIFGAFYGLLSNLQLNVSAGVNYFDYYDDKRKLKKYVSSIFTASLIISLVTLVIFAVLGPAIFSLFVKSGVVTFFPYGIIVLGSGFLNQVSTLYFVFLKNEYRLKEFLSYSIAFISLNAFFQFYLIVIMEMGVLGSILGGFTSKLIVTMVLLIKQRNLFDFNPKMAWIQKSLKFALPFVPIVFINWFFTIGDRLFLEHFLNLQEVGRYSLLINLLLLSGIFFGALMTAFRPYLFTLFKDLKPTNLKTIQGLVKLFVRIGLFTLSGVILIGTNINLITSNSKYLSVIPLFSLGALIMLPRLLLSIPHLQLMFIKESKTIFWCSFISLAVSIIGFIVFIPLFQLKGALYALGISNLVNFILLYSRGQKRFELPLMKWQNGMSIFFIVTLVLTTYFMCNHLGYSSGMYGLLQFTLVTLVVGLISIGDSKSIFNSDYL